MNKAMMQHFWKTMAWCMVVAIVSLGATFGLSSTATGAMLSGEAAKRLSEAQQQMERGRYSKASATLQQVLETRPGLAEAHRLLGHAWFEAGESAKARAAFIEALKHGRMTPAMLGRLTRLDRRADRPLATLGALRPLMLLEPSQPAWAELYADTLASLNALALAGGVYAHLLQKRPADPAVLQRLANHRIEQGRPRDAVTLLSTAYHLGARPAGLRRTLAQLHAQLDQPEAAAKWYGRAIKAAATQSDSTGTATLRLRRARLLRQLDRIEAARQAVQPLVDHSETSIAGQAHRLLGRLAMDQGREQQAVKHCTEAVEAGLNEPRLLSYLAAHHFNAGRYQSATKYLQRRLKRGEMDRSQQRLLVRSLLRSDQFDQAGQALQRYLEHAPLNDTARSLIRQWRQARAKR